MKCQMLYSIAYLACVERQLNVGILEEELVVYVQ
jgi:hypothetical protein